MFGIDLFKKAKNIPEEIINEIVKNGIVKVVMAQIEEAHDATKFVKDELIDMRRKVNFLHEIQQNKSNILPVIHFGTTLFLAIIVIMDKFG